MNGGLKKLSPYYFWIYSPEVRGLCFIEWSSEILHKYGEAFHKTI